MRSIVNASAFWPRFNSFNTIHKASSIKRNWARSSAVNVTMNFSTSWIYRFQAMPSNVTSVIATTTRDAPRKSPQSRSRWSARTSATVWITLSVVRLSRSSSSQLTTVSIKLSIKHSQHLTVLVIPVPPDTRTIRSCAFEEGNYKNKCYQRSGFGGRQEVCACDGELCNGAATIKATLGVLLAAIVVFVARA